MPDAQEVARSPLLASHASEDTLPGFIPIATELYVQSWMVDPLAVQGLAATDAVVKALQ